MLRFGLNTLNQKESFKWEQVFRFAKAYGVQNQWHCRLAVATMAVVALRGMCRYDDACRFLWRKVRFLEV